MITFIGAGNVAWHLAQAFEKVGCVVDAVYSRSIESAEEVASYLYGCQAVTELDFSESSSELFILAVPDDFILSVAQQLVLPENAILVHTSGTLALEDLQKTMDIYHDLAVECGVFYPLMTFTKGKKIDLKAVPFCIEATTETAENELVNLADQLSNSVQLVSSEERRVLHLAAVFACNFTNHLWAISQEITEANSLEFDLLKPLIHETFKKAMQAIAIATVQTGPAQRNDRKTIAAHLDLLSEDAELTKMYQLMTRSIQNFSN